jgi:hypothetical protein
LEADHTASALVRPTAQDFPLLLIDTYWFPVFSIPGIQSVHYGKGVKTATDFTVWLPDYVKLIADN